MNIKPIVNYCLVGGDYTDSSGSTKYMAFTYKACQSPQNQYCGHMIKNGFNFYQCMDACTTGNTGNGITYTCCNNSDKCNPDLTCISTYSGSNLLTPGPSNCLFDQKCMVSD